MNINIADTSEELGTRAAAHAARVINAAIAKSGSARIVLSTGASQLETIAALVQQEIDWTEVEGFHLDEYIGLPETHGASFRKYLKERFVSLVPIREFHYVVPEGDLDQNLRELSASILSAPIDLGLIGIGENGHIAFNDPPADFDTKDPYMVVTLDERCRKQQVGEGWFNGVDEVPQQAITMTVQQIMRCETIISCVPFAVKAEAIQAFHTNEPTPSVPATILKNHSDYHLYLDQESSALL